MQCHRNPKNPKHDVNRAGVSPQATNPEQTFKNSLSVGGSGRSRIGCDTATGEIVEFKLTRGNTYHGYATTWDQLKQPAKNALIDAGLFKPNGKPIK